MRYLCLLLAHATYGNKCSTSKDTGSLIHQNGLTSTVLPSRVVCLWFCVVRDCVFASPCRRDLCFFFACSVLHWNVKFPPGRKCDNSRCGRGVARVSATLEVDVRARFFSAACQLKKFWKRCTVCIVVLEKVVLSKWCFVLWWTGSEKMWKRPAMADQMTEQFSCAQ